MGRCKLSKELKIKTILLPVDGSEASLKAAKYAINLAKIVNAQLIAIHAVGMPLYLPKAKKTLISPYYEEAKRNAKEWMRTLVSIAKKENVELKTDIITNVASVSYAIVNYAKKHDVDLIIMGTRGRTGVKKFLLGSIAHGVVTLATYPVLVVR